MEEIKCPNCISALQARTSELEGDLAHVSAQKADGIRRIEQLTSEVIERDNEIDRLRMQLAACGVAALANTRESSALDRIPPSNPAYSASYADVCAAVEREIAQREEIDRLRKQIEWMRNCDNCARLEKCNPVDDPFECHDFSAWEWRGEG